MEPDGMTISEVAAAASVPVSTLRYYDRIGLLPAARRINNHRRYQPDVLVRLRLIHLCQGFGCTLQEVAVVLAPGAGQARRDLAALKLHEIDVHLAALSETRALLAHLAVCRHTIEESAQCHQAVIASGAR